jgi:hypothetical protein
LFRWCKFSKHVHSRRVRNILHKAAEFAGDAVPFPKVSCDLLETWCVFDHPVALANMQTLNSVAGEDLVFREIGEISKAQATRHSNSCPHYAPHPPHPSVAGLFGNRAAIEEDDINNTSTKEDSTDITTTAALRLPVGGDASGGQQANKPREPLHRHPISVPRPPSSLPVGGEASGGNQAHTPEAPHPHPSTGIVQIRLQVRQLAPPEGISPARWQQILAQFCSKHAREEEKQANINYDTVRAPTGPTSPPRGHPGGLRRGLPRGRQAGPPHLALH